jgi:hypothetical protein
MPAETVSQNRPKDALSQQLSLAKLDIALLLSRVFATLRRFRFIYLF